MAIKMNRRELIQFLMLVGAVGTVPLVCSAPLGGARKQRALVLVELNGGNDSLNCFIPLAQEERYKALRPALHLSAEERVKLDDNIALHKALSPLRNGWLDKDLALVHGLGYPEPNLSHFRSIEIWDTASNSDSYKTTGWLSSLAKQPTKSGVDALVLGRNSGPVAGGKGAVLQADLLRHFLGKSRQLDHIDGAKNNAAYSHLLSVQNNLVSVAKDLLPILQKKDAVKTIFPETLLGRQLAEIAQLINLGVDTPVYKVALSGFDTHRNQKPVHQRLLSQLSAALLAFREEMIRSGHWDDVVVMTYSEFGRRPKMNGSGGTDHGTAASHIVMGGKVRGGHIGKYPELPEKDNANMQFTTDFRVLYQTVLDRWFELPDIRLADALEGSLPLFRES
tara:strand:- start:1784 stop:2962 length:1179 start_codon:yes stop_codon:yes gene_type:complete